MAEIVCTVPPGLTLWVLSLSQLKEVQASRVCWWLLRGPCYKAFVWSEGLAGNSRCVCVGGQGLGGVTTRSPDYCGKLTLL